MFNGPFKVILESTSQFPIPEFLIITEVFIALQNDAHFFLETNLGSF